MFRCFFFTLLFTFGTLVHAATIHVPQDYQSIQAGIDAAVDGDTVLVADNTYIENISFKGKAITVASHFLVDSDTTHINNTIIDGSQPTYVTKGSVVSFLSGEDTSSVIYGFTITGGTGTVSGDHRCGGGIFCLNSGARISHNKIVTNTIEHNNHGLGGGICSYPYSNKIRSIIEYNLIESNSITVENAARGGGIHLPQGLIFKNIIRHNTVKASSYSAQGAGIYNTSRNISPVNFIEIIANTITKNEAITTWDFKAQACYGGGISITHGSRFEIINNIITNNILNASNVDCAGAGIRIPWGSSEASRRIQGNIIAFNGFDQAQRCYGGGIYCLEVVGITIENNCIEGNTATEGGALYSQTNTNCTISNNSFINNESFGAAGALAVRASECTISGNEIKGNSCSSDDGGGILIRDCSPVIKNNLIVENFAGNFGGGISSQGNSQPQIINNTIVSNTALVNGGGLYCGDASWNIKNSILWDNVAPDGAQIATIGSNTTVMYCDVMGSWEGEGNIDADPLFADLENYYLSDNSPCIDAGDPAEEYNDYEDSLNIGFALLPAKGTTRNDIGAYGGHKGIIITGVESQDISVNIPRLFTLEQNYPNPFNPSTTITYEVSQPAHVQLIIYDILGRQVKQLVNMPNGAGQFNIIWDATDDWGQRVAAGLYFCRMEAEGIVDFIKLVLVK